MPARTLDTKGEWIVRSYIDWREERVPAKTLDPEGGWIVRFYIGWRGDQNFLYKGVETSPEHTHFKNLEGKLERENPKRTISASGGLIRVHSSENHDAETRVV